MANTIAPPDMLFTVYWGAHYPPVEVPPLKIAEHCTYDEAMKAMSQNRRQRFPELDGYVRLWADQTGVINLDYGSWSYFYFFVPEGLNAEEAL